MVIGRDINVVAGMCTLIGHMSGSSSLWSTNYFMSGALATVMGGVLTFIGGNNIGANLLQVQNGVMVNLGACKCVPKIVVPVMSIKHPWVLFSKPYESPPTLMCVYLKISFWLNYTDAGVLATIGYGYTTVKFVLFRNIAGQFGTGKCTHSQKDRQTKSIEAWVGACAFTYPGHNHQLICAHAHTYKTQLRVSPFK